MLVNTFILESQLVEVWGPDCGREVAESSKAVRMGQEIDAESVRRVEMTGPRDPLRSCDFYWDSVVLPG